MLVIILSALWMMCGGNQMVVCRIRTFLAIGKCARVVVRIYLVVVVVGVKLSAGMLVMVVGIVRLIPVIGVSLTALVPQILVLEALAMMVVEVVVTELVLAQIQFGSGSWDPKKLANHSFEPTLLITARV